MGNTWVTSDLHIGHNKPFLYEPRGFKSIEEHDRALVKNWNELINADDTVYVLGDVMLKHGLEDTDFSYGLSVLQELNGRLIIIRGNHDSVNKIEEYKGCSNVISAGEAALYLNYPEVGSYHFYLSHYPTLISGKKLKSLKTALINLYGHTHQKEKFYQEYPYMYHVGLDAHDMRPVLLDCVIEDIRIKRSAYCEDELIKLDCMKNFHNV
ncbi:MAG: metallophosphoesterase family protein [Clostridiales bacterium]|nr:metallophosphoesterase family protein [Clostridiales bacterium]